MSLAHWFPNVLIQWSLFCLISPLLPCVSYCLFVPGPHLSLTFPIMAEIAGKEGLPVWDFSPLCVLVKLQGHGGQGQALTSCCYFLCLHNACHIVYDQ